MMKQIPARIHLLPAKGSPYVAVIRRKPSKVFRIIRWNTEDDHLEYSSWFYGKLYPKRCDISFDGKWMVYLAMGKKGQSWNGVCLLPCLKTCLEGESWGTYFGGGYWKNEKELLLNGWGKLKGIIPFRLGQLNVNAQFGKEDLSVLYPRLERDGWTRAGDNYGNNVKVKNSKIYMVKCENDDGWYWQPTGEHPTLRMHYRGYLQHGYTFEFSLDEYPDLLDATVDWATWDFLGNLVLAQQGKLYKYKLDDFKSKQPSFCKDLEFLEPPQKPKF
ncbi:hypothetical protein [Allocoleopsis sp.]|uniref:hypothetical protein n=1 Tax=Allocoleopsis sp. TaxID=3088169 RepID=UPI002FD5AFD3